MVLYLYFYKSLSKDFAISSCRDFSIKKKKTIVSIDSYCINTLLILQLLLDYYFYFLLDVFSFVASNGNRHYKKYDLE